MKVIRWVADHWIALVGSVTAFVALAITMLISDPEWKYRTLGLVPQIRVSYVYNESGAGFVMENAGDGPAIIYWTTVKVDGKVVPTWIEMEDALGFKAPPNFSSLTPSELWKAGSQQRIFWIEGKSLDDELRDLNVRVELETCYCTVFRECWIAELTKTDPRSVSSCLPKPEGYLRPSQPEAST